MWFFNFHVPSAKLPQGFTFALSLVAAFTKLQKASPSFVISTFPSVRPSFSLSTCSLSTLNYVITSNLAKFSWDFIFVHFSKICRQTSSFITIWQAHQELHMKIHVQFCVIISCRIMFRMRNIWDKIFRQNQNT